jgi:hypothetical protein
MESLETALAENESSSSGKYSVEDSVGNMYPKCYDTEINNGHTSHQGINLIVEHTKDCCTALSGGISNDKYEPTENTINNPHSTIEGLDISKQGIVHATNLDNLHSNVEYLGKKLDHYNKLNSNEYILPIATSAVQSDHCFKTAKVEDNDEVYIVPSVSTVINSMASELVCSTITPKQEDPAVLSANYEQLCSGDLLRRPSGSQPDVSLPPSVDCAQYDEGTKRQNRRKQKNKKRKRRSRGVDVEGLQTE